MAFIPATGSVVAFQSDPTKLVATVSVVGTLPVVLNNSSIITVNQGSVATVIIGGSIAASFTPPANQSVSGTVQTDVRGSVATVIIGGSIAATFVPPANQSVSGTVGASVIGHAPVVIVGGSIAATFSPPANQSVSGTVQTDVRGSVATVIIGGSIAASFTPPANQSVSGEVSISNFPTTQNVSGSVASFPQGTIITSLVSTVPSSVIVGASIFGALPPVTISNTNLNVSGSVAAWLQSTNASVITVGTAAANQSVSGTVDVAQIGTWRPSALSYVVRNDAVASFLGADLTYRPQAADSAGRAVVKPFAPEESRIEGYHSVVSTSVTTLVAAAGAGLKNYITDFFIANTGANTTVITFKDGLGSILGYTIAPAGGGSNSPGIATPFRTGANASFDFQPTTASSIIYATVKGYKAP